MVGAHLAAVRPVHLAHLLLDEGMARLAQHGHAAVPANDLLRVPGQPWVVNDPRARLTLQKHFREQADEVIPFDELTVLVEEKAPVVVTIPGESDVRLAAAYHVGGRR